MQRGECRWDQAIQKNEREKGDDYRGENEEQGESGRDICIQYKKTQRANALVVNQPSTKTTESGDNGGNKVDN